MIGASARLGVDALFAFTPWATLIVNVLGCFVIGWVMAAVSSHAAPKWMQPLLVVGVLGGFTTFSAFAAEVVQMLLAEQPLVAFGYIAATLVLGLVAVPLGERVHEGIRS